MANIFRKKMAPSMKPYIYFKNAKAEFCKNMTLSMEPCFTVFYLGKFLKKNFIALIRFCINLFSKMNIDQLTSSYDNKLFIPVDVPGGGNRLLKSLIDSDIISITVSKTLRSDLSIRTKIF